MKKPFWMNTLAIVCLSCFIALNGCGGDEEDNFEDSAVINLGDQPGDHSEFSPPATSNLFYDPMFRRDMDFAKALPPGIYTHFSYHERPRTVGKATDGTLLTILRTSNSTDLPSSELLMNHRLLQIQEWKDTGTLFAHEFHYPNINVFNSDEYAQLPLEGTEPLNSFNSITDLKQLGRIWEAYRGVPEKQLLTKGQDTRTIAGRECTEWIYVNDQTYDKDIIVDTHHYWIDKDNNCLRYQIDKQFNKSIFTDEYEISAVDQTNVATGDDLFAKIYGSKAGKTEDLFRNTYTRFDDQWANDSFPDNFNSCIDWNNVFSDYGVDDLFIPYTGTGTIDFTEISNDKNPFFEGVFEIRVRVSDVTQESVDAYATKLKSLPHITNLQEGEMAGIYALEFSAGDQLTLHAPPLSFGNVYGSIRYQLMYVKDTTNIDEASQAQKENLKDSLYIIFEIVRTTVV